MEIDNGFTSKIIYSWITQILYNIVQNGFSVKNGTQWPFGGGEEEIWLIVLEKEQKKNS